MSPDLLAILTKLFNAYTLAFVGIVEGVVIVHLFKQLTLERKEHAAELKLENDEHMATAKEVIPIVQKLVQLLDRRSVPRKRATVAIVKAPPPEVGT